MAERARLLQPEKLDFKSEATVDQICGHDELDDDDDEDDDDDCAALLDSKEASQASLASPFRYMLGLERMGRLLVSSV